MGMLAFFPWFGLDDEITVGQFKLAGFQRGERPAGAGSELQQLIDSVLEPYKDAEDVPIQHATLVQLENHNVTDDLTEEERNALFVFAECLTFASLSRREFFGIGFGYVNADHFRQVIQQFQSGSDGVAIRTRRRDGSTLNYVAREAYKVFRPDHVTPADFGVEVDVPLLNALLAARDAPTWQRYADASFGFNRANTDSNEVAEEAEVVFMIGAVERLLDCGHGNENDLARAFASTPSPSITLDGHLCTRIPQERVRIGCSVREFWMRDFFRVRGNLAHGEREVSYPAVWEVREHLLLGAYVLPLTAKCLLHSEGLYRLTENDRLDIDVFEQLASENLFARERGCAGRETWPWNRVRGEALWAALSQKAVDCFERSLQPGDHSDADCAAE